MEVRLRQLREEYGFTVRQMHTRLGVKDSRYRKWESNDAQIPLEYACACADILHCTLDELAGRKPAELTYSAEERKLIGLFRSTDERGRNAIIRTAEGEAGMEGKVSDDSRQAG